MILSLELDRELQKKHVKETSIVVTISLKFTQKGDSYIFFEDIIRPIFQIKEAIQGLNKLMSEFIRR